MLSPLEHFQNWRIHRQNQRYIRRETEPSYDRIERTWIIANTGRQAFGRGGYLDILRGLGHFLDYTESLSSPVIVDVGTGKGGAVRQLRERFSESPLRFIGTGLVEYPETIKNLGGRDNFRQTSAEFLDGIADASVGSIIGVHSIAHSKFGGRIARQFDRVLVDGGALKVNFYNHTISKISFAMTLRRMGYDVATSWKPEGSASLPVSSTILVVAIKPRKEKTPFQISAQELMERDMRDCDYQNAAYLRRL